MPSFAPIIACAATLRLSASSSASEQRVKAGVTVVPVAFDSLAAASFASLSTAYGVTASLDFGPYACWMSRLLMPFLASHGL
jgi:hypothetical protein